MYVCIFIQFQLLKHIPLFSSNLNISINQNFSSTIPQIFFLPFPLPNKYINNIVETPKKKKFKNLPPFHFPMHKNKTHRIISISPNNHQSSIKNSNHKSSTPIKPLHQHTRTNTIRTTSAKPDGSIAIDENSKNAQSKQKIIDSVYITSYKQDPSFKPQDFSKPKKQPNYQQLLSRLDKLQDPPSLHPSPSTHKINQINQLRQVIKQAKSLIRTRQDNNNTTSINTVQASKLCIETLSISLRQQIFQFFSILHKQLYNKQKQLYEQLQQKVYLLNEKHMGRSFQQSVLKTSIEKCQSDLNANYQQIIKQLQLPQLSQICKSYTQKLHFYMDLIQTDYTLKLNLPTHTSNLLNFLQNIQLNLQKQPPKQRKPLPQLDNVLTDKALNKHPSKLTISNQFVRQSLGRHTKNTQSNFQESMILPFKKIKMRGTNQNNESKPQIASARGKY